jgi:hypothetical protein
VSMIKSFCVALAIVATAAGRGVTAEAGQPPALAWHFVGTGALAAGNPESVLNQLAGLTNSARLANQIRSHLTSHLPGWIGLNTRNLSAEVVSPVIADLLWFESIGRLEGTPLGTGPWVLAVNLDAAGATRWNGSLMSIGRRLGHGEPQPVKLDALDGWQIPAPAGKRSFSFVVHRNWALVASDFAAGSTAARWLAGLAREGRPLPPPGADWLQFEVHPAAIDWHPVLPFAGRITHIDGTVSWQGKDLRTTAKLTLAEERATRYSAWQIPRGIVRDPLVSFTAARGVQRFLGGLEVVKDWPRDQVPDQWFGWSRSTVAFINDFALPVKDEAKAFARLEQSVPGVYNPRLLELALGQWLSATNQNRLLWRGLPVLVPYLGPVKDGSQGFLHGGIFPLAAQTNAQPAPDELFAQFEQRSDLIYYDWEITQARLAAFQQASPFIELFLPKAPPKSGTHGGEWLQEAQPLLENVVTEISTTGPRELAFTRRSQAGLTGIELWLLTRWLDSSEFPKFPYGKPQKPEPGARSGPPGMAPPPQR